MIAVAVAENEVLVAIVGAVEVYVMDWTTWRHWLAEHARDYRDMLKNVTALRSVGMGGVEYVYVPLAHEPSALPSRRVRPPHVPREERERPTTAAARVFPAATWAEKTRRLGRKAMKVFSLALLVAAFTCLPRCGTARITAVFPARWHVEVAASTARPDHGFRHLRRSIRATSGGCR